MEVVIGIAVIAAFGGFIYWRTTRAKASGSLSGGSGKGGLPKKNKS